MDYNVYVKLVTMKKHKMKKFKIPVTWEVCSTIIIEANSLEEAIEIFDQTEDEIGLPIDPDYIDASFQRGTLEECELYNTSINE